MQVIPRSAPREAARAGRSARLLRAGLPILAAALAGCGGGGAGSSNSVSVRDFNAIPDSGAATVVVGGDTLPGSTLSVNGNVISGQSFLTASSYTDVAAGARQTTFALSSFPGTTYPSASQTLTAGTFYSEMLFGRADVAASDARSPAVVTVADDRTAPPSGDARLRIVQAAPDIGSVDVLVDGQVTAGAVAYQNVGSYLNVTAGNHTVQVNKAGTSAVLVPAQTVSLTSGQLYSLFAVEPTLTPTPAYALQLQSDAD